ncbi:MAG: SAM-dependent methyltransferase [Bacteroidota bacterium]
MSTVAVTQPSSYRDPSGFIFEKDGVLYRQVNNIFKDDFDHFIKSGCYDAFVKKELLVPHREINENLTGDKDYYKTIQPEKIDFISYPYEWSFDMLKDAALLTLQLVKESIQFGMILKDATPYNIQWHNGKLIFIDTLSFEKYNETKPWIAYRQFCECFLGPLLLMNYKKTPLQQLFLAYPDGIPLPIIKSLLPSRSRLSLYTYLHIFLHANISSGNKGAKNEDTNFSKQKLINLISSLEVLVKKLKLTGQVSTWSDYYNEASKRNNYLEEKKKIITNWLRQVGDIKNCMDLGANDGEFSQICADMNTNTIAADFDPFCINNLYNKIKVTKEKNIQPLILDLSNPSPANGVNSEERKSFIQRADTDMVLALALVHHLAIGRNIPFNLIASFFNRITKTLIIEFVPKKDEKIQLMLKTKEDIYANYTEENFESEFKRIFNILKKEKIGTSGRVLYFMKRI